MNKTVCVLGAGVNKAINTPSTAPMCSPFLLNDFFQVALQMRNGRYSIDLTYDSSWVKFREEERPFGIPVKEKRCHSRISAGDIIQISNDFYMVNEVGARQIEVTM